MITNKTKKLSEINFNPVQTVKTQIIFGNSFNDNMKHFIGWENRCNGEYNKTAAYSIDKSGIIYEHFDPKYYSNYFESKELNNTSIIVILDNVGYLDKNDKNQFITWLGNIYDSTSDIYSKRWRGYQYWDSYTKKQFESAISLVNYLCKRFEIPKRVIGHNTKINLVNDNYGIIYKSNLDDKYTDVSPAWSFKQFKDRIEKL